jgi:hypothetical protein
MPRLRNKKSQALRFFTNGKRADDAFGLSTLVGQLVRRTDTATKRAVATTARRLEPIAKRTVVTRYNIAATKLQGKFSVTTTGDSIRLFASERRVPVIQFGGRWGGINTPGATAQIERGGPQQVFAGAFISTVKGLQSIRERTIRGGKRAPRGPLILLRGPSPRDMVTGSRKDQRGNLISRLPEPPGVAIVNQLREIYITELQRQIALGVRRG